MRSAYILHSRGEKMSSINDESRALPICKNCKYYFIRVIKENTESWIDVDTGDECQSAVYNLVCTHVDACKRAYGKRK